MITTAIAVSRWSKSSSAYDGDPVERATSVTFLLFASLMAMTGIFWSFADADVDRYGAQVEVFQEHPPQSIMEREMRAEAYAERAERVADRKHLAWIGFILWALWELVGAAINLLSIGVPDSWRAARQRWRVRRRAAVERARVTWKGWMER